MNNAYLLNDRGILVNELENGYFSLDGIKRYDFMHRNCTEIAFQTLRVKPLRKYNAMCLAVKNTLFATVG